MLVSIVQEVDVWSRAVGACVEWLRWAKGYGRFCWSAARGGGRVHLVSTKPIILWWGVAGGGCACGRAKGKARVGAIVVPVARTRAKPQPVHIRGQDNVV